jgi:PAS domain S-box-containing protein
MIGDATDRKQDEVQIATLMQRLDLAAHGAHLGIWDWDIVRNELLWDDRMYELYGVKADEFGGTHEAWLNRVHADDRSFCDDAIQRVLGGEKEYDIDFRVLRPDGTIRVIRANGQIVRDPWGTPIRMTGISSDITDRRRAEQRVALQLAVSKVLSESATLEEATPRLAQALVEAVSASFGALWRVDAAANVVRCINVWHRPDIDVKEFEPATSKSAFAPGVGLPGRVWQSRKPLWIPDVTTDANFPRTAAAEAAGLHAAFGAPILSGQTCLGVIEFFTHEIHKPDPELLEVCAGIGSQIGQFIERKQAEDELARLSAEAVQRATLLEEANKDLEAFSYTVSHDLRAPLRHVQGYVELLKKATADQLSEAAAGYVSAISDASKQMGQLIDDLLSFSRLGRAEMHRSTVRLDDIVQSCLAALELETGSRNILWKFAPLPSVMGDPAMLRQVFANLIGNAVKYTGRRERAEIEIGCAGSEDGRAIIFIRDNGVGFDMQCAGKLFGVFQRLHTTAEFEGTGIGLANVQRIITRHGGRIWADAAVDKGATFYFTLEEASPAPPDAAAK